MKHRISISILLSIFILVFAILLIKFQNDKNLEENYSSTEELVKEFEKESITTNQEYNTFMFYIKDDDGRLVVYDAKTTKIYLQTGIETKNLSKDLQEKLEDGIYFETEADLYDFLESHSS